MKKAAIVLMVFVFASIALAADAGVLLRGATVHPVSGPDIPNGMVLIKDGKIVEVGAKVSPLKGARVLDLKGLHVYPGMIDSDTQIGLSEISAVRETTDVQEVGDFNPQLRALVAVNPASEHIPVVRANGITSVVSTPGGGIVSGQAALVHLDGWTWEEMAVRPSVSMQLQFPVIATIPARYAAMMPEGMAGRASYAESRRNYERRLQQLREFFEEARRYQKAKAAGSAGFQPDAKYEAMLPVLEGKLPLVVVAQRERAIREALKFAETEKLKIVISRASEAWKVAADLKAKNVPVILGPTLALPLEEDDPFDKIYSQPAELHKAGVKFAFGSLGNQFARNLPYQAAMAVAFGLPQAEALKSVTLYAAEIYGVADQVGSIDKGKLADLIVTDGDPLETRTEIKYSFIQGKQVDLENNKHYKLYQQYIKRQ